MSALTMASFRACVKLVIAGCSNVALTTTVAASGSIRLGLTYSECATTGISKIRTKLIHIRAAIAIQCKSMSTELQRLQGATNFTSPVRGIFVLN